MFRLIAPAEDRSLVALDDLKAGGIDFAGSDAALASLAMQASDAIARACAVASAGPKPPTLRRERLSETIRGPCNVPLYLSRRFVEPVSVTLGGLVMDLAEVQADFSAGEISLGARARHDMADIAVVYDAGFDEVPEDLKAAAIIAVREAAAAMGRDPLLRSETIEGVGRFDYQIGGAGRDLHSSLSPEVMALIEPYRAVVIA